MTVSADELDQRLSDVSVLPYSRGFCPNIPEVSTHNLDAESYIPICWRYRQHGTTAQSPTFPPNAQS